MDLERFPAEEEATGSNPAEDAKEETRQWRVSFAFGDGANGVVLALLPTLASCRDREAHHVVAATGGARAR